MPSQAAADIIITKAANVLGLANVVVEYTFDPRASAPTEGTLFVADTVLFAPNSSDLAPDFVPILNLGVVLLNQNPKITIDIIGHTDSDGTAEDNLALAQRRCDAVIAYLAAAGVDPARLVSVPKGASEPIADNANPEGRRLNRRAEFIIRGLLED
jgi:OmpA-OmpF porin, OOP family